MTVGTEPKETAEQAAEAQEQAAKVDAAQPLSEEQLDAVSGGWSLMPNEPKPDQL